MLKGVKYGNIKHKKRAMKCHHLGKINKLNLNNKSMIFKSWPFARY